MSCFTAPSHLLPLTSSRRRNPSSHGVSPAVLCNLPSLSASKPSKSPPLSLKALISTKSIAVSAAAASSCFLFHSGRPAFSGSIFNFGGGGGGGDGGGSGGGGGGGGEGGGFWRFLSLPAVPKDDELPANVVVQLNKLSGSKKYKVNEILFVDRWRGSSVSADDPFFELLSLRPGGTYTKAELQKEHESLATCGMFEEVDMEAKTNPDGTINIIIPFLESTWQPADRIRCINVGLMPQENLGGEPEAAAENYRRRIEMSRPCLLPMSVQRELLDMLRENKVVGARLLQRIRERVHQWYHENGYACAQIVNFGNLNTKELVCEVIEGDITQLLVQFYDKLGNFCEGKTQIPVIRREFANLLCQGEVFEIEAAKRALRNLNSLALFSAIEINPRPDEKKEGGLVVEVKLKELEQKSAEVKSEWNIVPGRGGWPTLASIQPCGTVTFEHRNINGLNRSLRGSVTTRKFLNPQDDLGFKLEYVHPYVDGVFNPRNRTLRTSCFKSRKPSPVFTGGPEIEEVPPIWVDRAGVKANITENITRQSKITYGLVMEEITTRDEANHISANGQRVLPSGGVSANGPPTTLSGTGVDRMAFLQANIIRDNTKYVNGAIVGERNVFQFDQGLGIGSNFPVFNRHQLTLTRFIPLKQVEEGAGKSPPPVLVLHGHYGGCVGDLPSYDAFTLGGPYSVRGYNMGELGAARNILELAAELRIPVGRTHAYVFAEHGNDLGSSKDVKGNPTEVYRRMGHGSSYGVGMKLGQVRAEYAVDHNSGTGAIFFRLGERF